MKKPICSKCLFFDKDTAKCHRYPPKILIAGNGDIHYMVPVIYGSHAFGCGEWRPITEIAAISHFGTSDFS